MPGTKIVAQSPPGCIVPEGAGPQRKPCLFDFDVMQEYIIPRKAFFNRFVAVNEPEGKYTVLGLPVAIAHPKYQRNEFIFNFGLVVVSLPPGPYPVRPRSPWSLSSCAGIDAGCNPVLT